MAGSWKRIRYMQVPAIKHVRYIQGWLYNNRSVFLEKWYTKYGGETIPRLFSKNQNWVCIWVNCLKFYTVCLYCMSSWGLRNILISNCRPLVFASYKALLKTNKRSGPSVPASLDPWFLKKNISLGIFYYLPNFIVWLFSLLEILGNMCVAIVY